jgi:hypothetical protein
VPSNSTIGGLEFGIGDAVQAHDAVKAGIGLTESNGKVGDFCINISRQLKYLLKLVCRDNALQPSTEPQEPAPV